MRLWPVRLGMCLGFVLILGACGSPGQPPAASVPRSTSAPGPDSALVTATTPVSSAEAPSSDSAASLSVPASPAMSAAAPKVPTWSNGVYHNEVIALMYHSVREEASPGDDITVSTFAQELALFASDGYHVITLGQFEEFIRGKGAVPPNAVLLTFDNGYQSFYQQAYPVLVQYHDPAVLFAIGSWLDSGSGPAGTHTLNWAEVRTMAASSLLSVQGQTWDMHRGITVGPGKSEAADIGLAFDPATGQSESQVGYDQRVLADLQRSQRDITSEVGVPANAFAYPFGDYDPALIDLLRQAGFQYLFAAKLGWGNIAGQSPDVLYRLNVGASQVTPTGALAAIQTLARDTARDPGWRPPKQYVEVWS